MEAYAFTKDGTMRKLPRDFALEWWAWSVICFVSGLLLGLYWKIGG